MQLLLSNCGLNASAFQDKCNLSGVLAYMKVIFTKQYIEKAV